jgi:hypothetical protein
MAGTMGMPVIVEINEEWLTVTRQIESLRRCDIAASETRKRDAEVTAFAARMKIIDGEVRQRRCLREQ